MAFVHPILSSPSTQHQHLPLLPLPPSAKRMQETIALYVAPALHHMVSMVELGKLILHHRPQFTLTVLVASMPATASAITSYIDRIYNEINLPISFFHLPPVHLPESLQNQVDTAFEFMRLNITGVRDALQSISADCAVRALITSAFHVPHHFLNIPTYCYFTSCASVLSFFLQLPAIHDQTSKSFGDSKDTLLHLPGLPTMRASLLPEPLLDRNASAYRHFLDFARSLPKFHGLIANTFNLLEPDAVKAVADGVCVPDGMTPPLYCIGPLIADAKDQEVEKRVRQLIMEVNMRERSAETKERGIAAWTEGGSSFLALSEMVGSWKQG
ncbi:hypothetical protein ACJRO7_033702 [Eucalyptus globulus]|uniref:Uncharacterized protein n=1 Tax=Eucalyptus globulus TaxID=34317 RepID=A0ABD3K084_EUCGL